MDMNNKGGWFSSARSFLGGVAKEVGSLVSTTGNEQTSSSQTQGANLTSPIGNRYQPNQPQMQQQQQQPMYGQQPSMYGQNHQQSGYMQPSGQQHQPPSHDYMSQFDNVLNREMQNNPQNTNGYNPYGHGSNIPSPAHGHAPPSAYGQVDNSWQESDDGILPVVPLAQQFGAAPSTSRSGSRRGSIDASAAPAFPTSHFPSSPPSALSQQLQPLGHPNYTPTRPANPSQPANPQPIHSQGNIHNISEFTGVTAVSGSPSPPPTGVGSGVPTFQAPFNPLLPSTSYPLQPANPNSTNSAFPNQPPNSTFPNQPINANQPPPTTYNNAPQQPPLFNPGHISTAPPRRVLDENSINPALVPPQPNPAYSGYNPSYSQSSNPHLSSPGRVLSPAFNTSGDSSQTLPAGNTLRSPSMPPPMMNQSTANMSAPTPAPSAGGASSGLLPPPPPVSSYWKQRAAIAGPEPAEERIGRVDYSDLDYKSMDFAYNNRYERDQQQPQVPSQSNPYSNSYSQQSANPYPSQPTGAFNQPPMNNYNPYGR